MKLESNFHRHRCVWVCYKDTVLGKYCQTGVIIEPSESFKKIARFVALASYSQANVVHGSSQLSMEANTKMESYLKKQVTKLPLELKLVIFLGSGVGLGGIAVAVYRLFWQDRGKICEDDARNLIFLGLAGSIIMLFVCEYVRTKTKFYMTMMHKRYLAIFSNILKGVALFCILATTKPGAFFLLNQDEG